MNLGQFERERKMFGCPLHNLQSSLEHSPVFQTVGYHMVAMSMMSDAQQAMENKDYEWARQLLNRAKWVLSTYKDKQ